MTAEVIISLLQALLSVAPQIPELIAGVNTAIGLLGSGKAITPVEQASIDAALDAINAQLQAS